MMTRAMALACSSLSYSNRGSKRAAVRVPFVELPVATSGCCCCCPCRFQPIIQPMHCRSRRPLRHAPAALHRPLATLLTEVSSTEPGAGADQSVTPWGRAGQYDNVA